MNARLREVFANLDECEVFADIGCDHGYMAEAMIKSGKCKKAIISDVSEKCLSKAEELLAEYIVENKVLSVVSDGFEKVGECDLALIAGMGGEEIISIINGAKALPEKLVLQPMKNTDKVRVALVKSGYKIVKDYVFYAGGKFYDLIVLKRGSDVLSEEEIEFGRTNVLERGDAFVEQVKIKIEKYEEYLLAKSLSEETKIGMLSEIEKLKKYVKN